jgi:hypothetical protein
MVVVLVVVVLVKWITKFRNISYNFAIGLRFSIRLIQLNV